jgi:hypothetical protein
VGPRWRVVAIDETGLSAARILQAQAVVDLADVEVQPMAIRTFIVSVEVLWIRANQSNQ